MENPMTKTDYYNKYYEKGYRDFISKDCYICDCEFYVPKAIENKINTCSKYCSSVLLRKKKLKGFYIQCRVCDKLTWKAPSKNRKYCGQTCAYIGGSIYTYERNIRRGTYKKYYGVTWLPQRNRARERDNYLCQRCGISEENLGMQMSVHHKIPFQLFECSDEANKLSNLTCLCEPCHRKEHSGENHHSKYLKNKR